MLGRILIENSLFTRYAEKKQVFFGKQPLARNGKQQKKHLWLFLRILVGVGALVWIFRDPKQLISDFGQVQPLSFLLALFLFICGNFAIALRWAILLRTQKIRIQWWACIKIHFLGLYYNNIGLGSMGGDLLKAWYVTHHTEKRLEAAFSVIVDRVIGLFCLVCMAGLFYLFFPVAASVNQSEPELSGLLSKIAKHRDIVVYFGTAVVLCLVILMIIPIIRSKVISGAKTVVSRRHKVFLAIKLYLKSPGVLFLMIPLTIFAQSLTILGLWYIGRSVGVPVALKYYFVIFPVSWIIGAIPIVPGGWGVLEVTVSELFKSLGATVGQGELLAVCQRLIFLLASLPGLVVYLTGRHRPSD